MRRISQILRAPIRNIGKYKNKKDFIEQEKKKKSKKILKIKMRIYKIFHDKYSNPYIYKAIPQDLKDNIKEEQIPTYFSYYKIIKLCNNIPSHFLSIYHELNLFYDFQNQYVNKLYSLFESNLIIKYSIYNECTFFPNFFPLGFNIYLTLKKYLNKEKKLNEMIIEKNIFLNEEKKKKKSLINLDKNIQDEQTNNILDSLKKENDESESYSDYDNGILSKKKKDKNKRGNDSINSIIQLTKNITKIEKVEEKKKLEKKKNKKIIIDAFSKFKKKESELIKDFNNDKIKRKTERLKTLKITKNSLLDLSKKTIVQVDNEKNNLEELYYFNNSKFKSTFDFITNLKEKEKKEKSKKNVIKQCIDIIKDKRIIEKQKYHKQFFIESHFRSITQDILSINDLFENEKELESLNKTNSLFRKVNQNEINEKRKYRNLYHFDSLLTCPNIYKNKNFYTIQPKSKFKLRIRDKKNGK